MHCAPISPLLSLPSIPLVQHSYNLPTSYVLRYSGINPGTILLSRCLKKDLKLQLAVAQEVTRLEVLQEVGTDKEERIKVMDSGGLERIKA